MNIITVDFETYYDSKIKLGFKHQTTEEYVRDERFEVVGVSIAEGDGMPVWYSGDIDSLKKRLKENYDWKNSLVLAHNAQFDGAILSWIFGIHPKGYLDTLCMARAIHGVEAGGSLAKLAERYGTKTSG